MRSVKASYKTFDLLVNSGLYRANKLMKFDMISSLLLANKASSLIQKY